MKIYIPKANGFILCLLLLQMSTWGHNLRVLMISIHWIFEMFVAPFPSKELKAKRRLIQIWESMSNENRKPFAKMSTENRWHFKCCCRKLANSKEQYFGSVQNILMRKRKWTVNDNVNSSCTTRLIITFFFGRTRFSRLTISNSIQEKIATMRNARNRCDLTSVSTFHEYSSVHWTEYIWLYSFEQNNLKCQWMLRI